jgi:hypothetical protein
MRTHFGCEPLNNLRLRADQRVNAMSGSFAYLSNVYLDKRIVRSSGLAMHRIRLGQNSASIHWTLLIWLFFLAFQNPIANAQVDDSEPLPPLIAEFRGKAIQSFVK